MDKIKYYEVRFDSDVYAISLVDEPAIEEDFLFLSKQERQVKLSEEKRLVVGPVLIPDKKIYRYDGYGEYYIQFSKETIEHLAHKYMMKNHIYSVTTQHEESVDDVALVESWIKTSENDKINDLGIDVPIGTWLVAMKVNNPSVWQRVKDGELRGFSIESFVNLDEIMMFKKNTQMNKEIEYNESFWDKMKAMLIETLSTNKKEELSEEVEETVEEITEEVEETVEETTEEVAEEKNELQDVVDELKASIEKKDEEIANLSKQIEKLSKQPSADPIQTEMSAEKKHPSFFDFASGRVKY